MARKDKIKSKVCQSRSKAKLRGEDWAPGQFSHAENLVRTVHECEICKKGLSVGERYIDHNHANGKVRGILCVKCNFGLGCFQDDKEILVAAIQYLIDTD